MSAGFFGKQIPCSMESCSKEMWNLTNWLNKQVSRNNLQIEDPKLNIPWQNWAI